MLWLLGHTRLSCILHLGWFECQSDCVSFVGLEYCVCLLGYRMPPAKSSRGRPARQQQPLDRQTRSRTAAGRPATRSPAALGAPPPECTVQQDFDDAPGLQAVLLDDAASARRAWERDMERRMASSERMLHEIHAMVLALRRLRQPRRLHQPRQLLQALQHNWRPRWRMDPLSQPHRAQFLMRLHGQAI